LIFFRAARAGALQTLDFEDGAPRTRVGAMSDQGLRLARKYPFIVRLTRAYLNFEVKDAPKARGLRPGIMAQTLQAI